MTRRALTLVAMAGIAAGALADEPSVQEDYTLHCSGCHRPDGSGTPGVVPSLRGLGAFPSLEEGRSYLARVPGVAQAPLSDARLARLLNWILLRFSGVAPEPRYVADEVGRLRRDPLRDPLPARAAVVDRLRGEAPRR